jgi:hypothetical protein
MVVSFVFVVVGLEVVVGVGVVIFGLEIIVVAFNVVILSLGVVDVSCCWPIGSNQLKIKIFLILSDWVFH